MSAAAPTPAPPGGSGGGDGGFDPELDEVAMLGVLVMLAGGLMLGKVVQRSGTQWIGEAAAGLLLGMVVGGMMHAAGVSESFGKKMGFKADFFMLVLMPAIVFDAAYNLDAQAFVRNVGSICMTAFVGTTISTIVIGMFMWVFGALGWCHAMPPLYALIFGAIISATDPVAVLAVFESLGANPDLYINVFGEAVLNDAVALVLYSTIGQFLDEGGGAGRVFLGPVIFLGIFVGSVMVGVTMGFAAAFMFKTGFFHAGSPMALSQRVPKGHDSVLSVVHQRHESPRRLSASDDGGHPVEAEDTLQGAGCHGGFFDPVAQEPEQEERHHEVAACYETALVLVFAYISYMAATAAYLSGITAIMATGMMMNAYMRPNISEPADTRVSIVSKTLAITFELFAFVYIGLSVLQEQHYDILPFTVLTLLMLAVSRALNICTMVVCINSIRPPERHIPRQQQFMMWWSGLRGPMAFALALDASEKYGEHGRVMKTCTLYIVLVTVLINGGMAAYLMRFLRLRKVDALRGPPEMSSLLAHVAPGDDLHRHAANDGSAPDDGKGDFPPQRAHYLGGSVTQPPTDAPSPSATPEAAVATSQQAGQELQVQPMWIDTLFGEAQAGSSGGRPAPTSWIASAAGSGRAEASWFVETLRGLNRGGRLEEQLGAIDQGLRSVLVSHPSKQPAQSTITTAKSAARRAEEESVAAQDSSNSSIQDRSASAPGGADPDARSHSCPSRTLSQPSERERSLLGTEPPQAKKAD